MRDIYTARFSFTSAPLLAYSGCSKFRKIKLRTGTGKAHRLPGLLLTHVAGEVVNELVRLLQGLRFAAVMMMMIWVLGRSNSHGYIAPASCNHKPEAEVRHDKSGLYTAAIGAR